MNLRRVSSLGVLPLLLVMQSCTSQQETETIDIIGGVLQAGGTLLPTLTNGDMSGVQAGNITQYINVAATLAGTVIGALQNGSVSASTVDAGFAAVARRREAIGEIPPSALSEMQIMGSGIKRLRAIVDASPAGTVNPRTAQLIVKTPHVSMIAAPMTYLKLSRLRHQAETLCSKTAGVAGWNPFN